MSSIGSTLGGLVSGITPGVGAVAGSALSAGASLIGGQQTNSSAADNVIQQEQFQNQESSTAYQRAVADMEAAGLNPMLAYSQGGASSPSGSVAPVVNALGEAMQAGVSNYSSLQSANQVDPNIANTRSQTNLNNALVAKAAADTTSALSSARATNALATKTESGSLLSDVIGSTAAAKGSQYLNSAIDNATSKVSSLISNITNSSAYSAVSRGAGAVSDGVQNLVNSFSQ